MLRKRCLGVKRGGSGFAAVEGLGGAECSEEDALEESGRRKSESVEEASWSGWEAY